MALPGWEHFFLEMSHIALKKLKFYADLKYKMRIYLSDKMLCKMLTLGSRFPRKNFASYHFFVLILLFGEPFVAHFGNQHIEKIFRHKS
jgi:hypothetical protein